MTAEERRRFEQIENQMSETRKHMFEIGGKLDDVINLLKGDDYRRDGLVTKVDRMEKFKNRFTWTVLGASVPSGYGVFEFLKKVFPPMLVLLLFTSCMTHKKREDIAHRYIREHPSELAALCAERYPARPSVGGVRVVRDTVIDSDTVRVRCPDSTFVEVPTVRTRYVDRLRVDTVVDVALVDALRLRLSELGQENAALEYRASAAERQAKSRLLWLIGISVVAVVVAVMWLRGLFRVRIP